MKPKSLIRRRKTYRDEEGTIVGYGAEEAYFVANPRDYETHPLREGEIRNTSIFHRSMTEALLELSDPVRKVEWSKHWHAQLNEPEPDAPVDRKTGKRHIYPASTVTSNLSCNARCAKKLAYRERKSN